MGYNYYYWEIGLLWTAVALYAVATFFISAGMIWVKPKWQRLSNILCSIALMPHGAAILIRWYEAGHGPYIQKYESLSSHAWIGIAIFLIMLWKMPKLQPVALIVYPMTLLFSGAAVFASKEITQVPATFRTFWLIVHILFGKLAYGSALISTSLSALYVLKAKDKLKSKWIERTPNLNWLDYYSYRFAAFAFLMVGVMIAAGAIWANQAWGRYWAWDPIETWALITWLFYGLYLHYRFTRGKQLAAAVFNVFIIVILIISFFTVPFLYDTVHSEYLQ